MQQRVCAHQTDMRAVAEVLATNLHLSRGTWSRRYFSDDDHISRSPSGARCGMAILGNMCIISFFTGVCIRRPSVIFVAVQMVSFGNLLPAVRRCARPFIDYLLFSFLPIYPAQNFNQHLTFCFPLSFSSSRFGIVSFFSESEHRHSHPPSALVVRSRPACPQ